MSQNEPPASSQERKSSLRVMTWNFLEGGFDTSPENIWPRTPNPTRRAAATALIKRVNPDILTLNEALCCTQEHQQATDYAKLFGFPYYASALYDSDWGNAILSRFPILQVYKHRFHGDANRHQRGWIAAKIDVYGTVVWVATYHPHPSRPPECREKDLASLMKKITNERSSEDPLIFAGDLNAVAIDDKINAAQLETIFSRFQNPEQARVSANQFYLSGKGLLGPDGFFQRNQMRLAETSSTPTVPTGLVRQEGDAGLRIDHILVNRPVTVINAWVETAEEADRASDHYPVVADIDF